MCSVRQLVSLLLVGTGIFATTGISGAQDSGSAKKSWTTDELLAGMRDERLRLTSGVYKAKGRVSRYDGSEGDVFVFSAFDFPNGLMRFDRSEPKCIFDPNGQKEMPRIEFKLSRTPTRDYLWNQTQVLVFRSGEANSDWFGPPFDLRTFGMMNWSSIDDGATFDKSMDIYRDYDVVGNSTKNGISVVTYQLGPNDDVRKTLWIDPSRGFTIPRAVLRARKVGAKEWSGAMYLTEVEWKQISEVWVPTSLRLESRFNGDETYSLDLDWQSVNEGVPPELLEPKGMGLPPGTRIVDRRGE